MGDYNAVTEANKLFPPEDGEYRGVDRNDRAREAFILGAGWQAGRLLNIITNQIQQSQMSVARTQAQISEGFLGVRGSRAALTELEEHNKEALAYRYILALLTEELRPD